MKKQSLLICMVSLLVLGLVAGVGLAQPPVDRETFLVEDFAGATQDSLDQYWRPDFSYIEVNTDPEYVMTGDSSLKFVKDLTNERQANVLLSSDHPNWDIILDNFSLGFWIYIDDHENIYDNEWALFLATHSDGEWIDAILNMRQSHLEPGWNWVDTYVMFGDEIDELMFGFNYYGEEEVATYIDSIYSW